MSKILSTFVLLLLLCVVGFVCALESKKADQVRNHLDKLVQKKKTSKNNNNNHASTHKHPTLQSIVKKNNNANIDDDNVIADKIKLQMNCTVCSNKEDCCNDGPNTTSTCCHEGQFCCDSNTPVPATCCQDTCCSTETETCCRDDVHGGICCESELTQCCPPVPEVHLASRCCPNWNICCDQGRYGCCDPDTGRPIEETDALQIAHALLLEPEWISGNMKFDAATINLASGNFTQTRVSNFKTWGETQRSFMYDRNRDVFYLLQANFTGPPTPGDDPKRAIHLYTVDAATGSTTSLLVTGADDLVTGYHFVPEQNVIVMSTVYYTSASKTEAGFKFFHVNPTTAHATFVSEQKSTLDAAGKYDGWFHEVSPDLKYSFRLGYEHILTQENWGLGVSDLSKNPVQSTWVQLPFPAGHNNLETLTIVDSASPTVRAHFPEFSVKSPSKSSFALENLFFLSLAGSYNSSRYGDLDLFLWPLQNPSSIKQIARFKNAHTTPQFGPIQESVNADGTLYAALVVCDDPISNNYDVWCLATAETHASTNSTSSGFEYQLTPGLLAETVSVAGLGIPKSTTRFYHGYKK